MHRAATDASQMRLSCASLTCDTTQAYDAVGATGGADYPVTDLLQMMGRASRPDIDDAGRRAPSPPGALPTLLPSSFNLACHLQRQASSENDTHASTNLSAAQIYNKCDDESVYWPCVPLMLPPAPCTCAAVTAEGERSVRAGVC